MARQTAPQKQLITWRQALIALTIIGLAIFAYKYTLNAMHFREVQAQYLQLSQAVDRVKEQQAQAEESLINSLSPQEVDKEARELGWVKKGDTVYVVLTPGAPSGQGETTTSGDAPSSSVAQTSEPNWQRWWDLLFKQ